MTRTVVHLLRHGEVFNPRKILYGRLPGYHLSDLGRTMAERAAAYFTGRDVVTLVASPLERAQETAGPIGAALGLPTGTDDRLIEAANAFEGRAFGVGDGVLRHPSSWPLLRNPFRPSWASPTPSWPPGWAGPSRRPGRRPSGTRRCWSAISCRSGSRGSPRRGGASCTTRAAGSARWPR